MRSISPATTGSGDRPPLPRGVSPKLHMHSGLREAHDVLEAYMEELHAEHHALPPTFFGNCRPRHHEITTMGKALVELSRRFVVRGAEILAEKEVER